MSPHCLRRGALHLPAQRSRQNANLFLREPLWGAGITAMVEVESLAGMQPTAGKPYRTYCHMWREGIHNIPHII
jgi:hypothetical protein